MPSVQLSNPDLNDRVHRGRGATTNRVGRFEAFDRERTDDGWSLPKTGREMGDAPEPARVGTELIRDTSRSVIARNTSPDVPFDRSINPYRGCEHGCVYCFARPTHAYLGYSAGVDFETKLLYKPDAAEILRHELAKPSYKVAPIAMGTNTDPYQPVERKLRITRAILEVLSKHNHPVTIVTKGAGITRDLDILAPMAAKGLAAVSVSVTSLDHRLSNTLEPRASTLKRRLDAIRILSAAGIPTGVNLAPVIPGLTDMEMERIMTAAAKAGARRAGYILLRLPGETADLFTEWLAHHKPDRAGRVLSLVQQTRGGRRNDPRFGSRMVGSGPVADMIAQRFKLTRKKLGLDQPRSVLNTDLFSVPGAASQMGLFD